MYTPKALWCLHQITETIPKNSGSAQILDTLKVEKERGITGKNLPSARVYSHNRGVLQSKRKRPPLGTRQIPPSSGNLQRVPIC